MHKPPLVDFPVGDSLWFSRVWLAIWSVALSIDLLWLFESDRGDWRPWCGLVVTVLAAAAATRIRGVASDGTLLWDGDGWWWEHAALRTGGVVTSALDLHSVMLLRFVSDSGSRYWFALARAADPARWLALRRAVHAPAVLGDPGHAGERLARGTDRAAEP